MVINKFRTAFFLTSALLHAGLAVAIIGTAAKPVSAPVEVVLFEVKGDHKDLTGIKATRLSPPVAARPTSARKKFAQAPIKELATASEVSKSESGAAADTADSATGLESSGRFGSDDGLEVSAQDRYTAELRAMLERRKEYPILAKRLRQQGKVLVRFTLQRDGKVMRAEVIENSEFDSLNRAAEKLITSINGLKPFPEEMKKAELVFVLPVEYRM